MPSSGQPPEAPSSKPGSRGDEASSAAPAGAAAAPLPGYPKPPTLLLRLLFLCLKPESWAAAARYPTRYTLMALAVGIVTVATAVGVADGMRITRALQGLATNFPPMEYTSAGILKAKGDLPEPVRVTFPLALVPINVIIDPSNKTTLNAAGAANAILITDHEVVERVDDGEWRAPLEQYAGYWSTGGNVTIDGAVIRRVAAPGGIVGGVLLALVQLVADIIWAAVMLFFLAPLVTLAASVGDRRLLLPKRAAYRMSAALLVPLVVFGGLLHAAGYPVSSLLGRDGALLFWFFAACAMGVWTGVMARGMFGPRRRSAPRS